MNHTFPFNLIGFSGVMIAIGLALGISSPVIAQGVSADESSCLECHRELSDEQLKPVTEWEKSIHREGGVGCESCHGGDPTDPDITSMETPDFVGKPEHSAIPALCAKCHEDPQQMRRYRLRVDQFDFYKHSGHGRMLFGQGDTKVATCISCHGAHEVRKKTDPLSPVYATNVPSTCAKCHSDPEYMKGYNLPTNQYDKYMASYHGQILSGKIEGKNPVLAPTCATCHTHGALPPDCAEVEDLCGSCHVNTAKYFKEGPHYTAVKTFGFPRCVDCHGNHKIEFPSLAMFSGEADGHCGSCHEPNSKEGKVAQQLETILKNSKEDIELASTNIKEIAQNGRNIDDLHNLLDETETYYTEALPAVHSLAMDKVEEKTREIQNNITLIGKSVKEYKQELENRKKFLLASCSILFGLGVLLYLKKRVMLQQRHMEQHPVTAWQERPMLR